MNVTHAASGGGRLINGLTEGGRRAGMGCQPDQIRSVIYSATLPLQTGTFGRIVTEELSLAQWAHRKQEENNDREKKGQNPINSDESSMNGVPNTAGYTAPSRSSDCVTISPLE